MNIKWIVGGFAFFAAATALGLAFSLLGPIHLVRVLGLLATIGGGAGMSLHALVLHRSRPDRLARWRDTLVDHTTRVTGTGAAASVAAA